MLDMFIISSLINDRNAKLLVSQWKKMTEVSLIQDENIVKKAQIKYKIGLLEEELARRHPQSFIPLAIFSISSF